MNNITGAHYIVSNNVKTKRNKVQPGKVDIIMPSAVEKCLQVAPERQK